jgi:hypothetical protein
MIRSLKLKSPPAEPCGLSSRKYLQAQIDNLKKIKNSTTESEANNQERPSSHFT